MGLCSSSEGAQQTKAFDHQNQRDAQDEEEKVKLLLLGAGQSGKSTIFKQMKLLYGKGFTERDRVKLAPIIHANVISFMTVLIDATIELDIPIRDQDAVTQFEEVSEDGGVDERVGTLIKALWSDEGIQEAYARRCEFQLNDSANYYFDKVETLMAPGYVPSIADVLYSRVRTSGIVTDNFLIDDVNFEMYDVGGQRNERKKWIHCFDNVTAVIFVASLAGYDQVLAEDVSTNRLMEALTLYDQICQLRAFANRPIMLFLNKKDLFEEKIKLVDIRGPAIGTCPARFQDYAHGTCTCGGGFPTDQDCTCGVQDKAKAYVQQKFEEANDHACFPYVTCATDSSNIKFVFNTCKDIILQDCIAGSGFMD